MGFNLMGNRNTCIGFFICFLWYWKFFLFNGISQTVIKGIIEADEFSLLFSEFDCNADDSGIDEQSGP